MMEKFKIAKEETAYEGFFTIKKARIKREDLSGEMIEVEREMLERGDSVGVLVYEKDTQSLVLTRQFRYPAQRDDGYLMEIAAGGIEEGETPEQCVRRELKEELGYEVEELEYIAYYYSTPGTSSERIFLYYAELRSEDRTEEGGGSKKEQEDIELIRHPAAQISDLIFSIKDAKSVIALQWFFIHKM
jgi:ADP-ribose pyrophosphatase